MRKLVPALCIAGLANPSSCSSCLNAGFGELDTVRSGLGSGYHKPGADAGSSLGSTRSCSSLQPGSNGREYGDHGGHTKSYHQHFAARCSSDIYGFNVDQVARIKFEGFLATMDLPMPPQVSGFLSVGLTSYLHDGGRLKRISA